MSAHLPKYAPTGAVTRTASATITAGQLLKVSGDKTVAPTTAGDAVRGIAGRDAASGEILAVLPPAGVHVLVAAENIAAGAYIQAGAAGEVALWENGTDDPEACIGVAEQAVVADASGEFFLH